MMIIRKEEAKDYHEIYECVKAAFDSGELADGNEADLVKTLRLSEAYITELALVAEVKDKIVGHIMFTKAMVGTEEVLALAPLSVLPEYQRKGIGRALIEQGHRIGQDLGYSYSVVLGSENYYPRFGYIPATSLGIMPPFEVADANFMACKLGENTPSITGVMQYAEEFGIE